MQLKPLPLRGIWKGMGKNWGWGWRWGWGGDIQGNGARDSGRWR